MDIYHYCGGDLVRSPSGDLQTVTGIEAGTQRVLRRLVTNAGDYCWHPTYGGSLPRMVGELADVAKIAGVIRQQLALESVVARTPEPTISVQAILDGISVYIQYTDKPSGQSKILAFDITR